MADYPMFSQKAYFDANPVVPNYGNVQAGQGTNLPTASGVTNAEPALRARYARNQVVPNAAAPKPMFPLTGAAIAAGDKAAAAEPTVPGAVGQGLRGALSALPAFATDIGERVGGNWQAMRDYAAPFSRALFTGSSAAPVPTPPNRAEVNAQAAAAASGNANPAPASTGAGGQAQTVYGAPWSESGLRDDAGIGRGAVRIDATPQGTGDAVGVGQRNTIFREGNTYTGVGTPAAAGRAGNAGGSSGDLMSYIGELVNRARGLSGSTPNSWGDLARIGLNKRLTALAPSVFGHEVQMGQLGVARGHLGVQQALAEGPAFFGKLMEQAETESRARPPLKSNATEAEKAEYERTDPRTRLRELYAASRGTIPGKAVPLFGGIYGGDSGQVSGYNTMPQF